jgi:hypothetical protein
MATSAPITWQDESEELLSPRAIMAIVVGALATLNGLALFLVVRRMMGAFTSELPFLMLAVTALVAFALVLGLRILWRHNLLEATLWITWSSCLTIPLLALGLSSSPRDWLVWLPLIAADQIVSRKYFSGASSEKTAIPAQLADDQIQQINRTRDGAGHETIHATLRADFQMGQRHATVYVGFCPPLASVPEITAEAMADSVSECKIVQAFPHGARIDLRLASPAWEETSITIYLTASSQAT